MIFYSGNWKVMRMYLGTFPFCLEIVPCSNNCRGVTETAVIVGTPLIFIKTPFFYQYKVKKERSNRKNKSI
jgi:hypothetical protein